MSAFNFAQSAAQSNVLSSSLSANNSSEVSTVNLSSFLAVSAIIKPLLNTVYLAATERTVFNVTVSEETEAILSIKKETEFLNNGYNANDILVFVKDETGKSFHVTKRVAMKLSEKVQATKPNHVLVGGDFAGGKLVFSDIVYSSAKEAVSVNRLLRRPGVDLSSPVTVQFESFSALGLTKPMLDGVFGFFTDRLVSSLQGTLSLDANNLMAKGLLSKAVSPAQQAVVRSAKKGTDLLINLDEVKNFFGSVKPSAGSVRTLVGSELRLMDKVNTAEAGSTISRTSMEFLSSNEEVFSALVAARTSKVLALVSLFNSGNFAELLARGVVSDFSVVGWAIANNIQLTAKQVESVKASVEEALVRLYSEFELTAFSRYVSANETLSVTEMTAPSVLKGSYPVGSKVLVLSHPMIFDLTYSVVEVVGHHDSDVWAFNPDMLALINRDCDGDKMSLPVPSELNLTSVHAPSHASLSAKDPNAAAKVFASVYDILRDESAGNIGIVCNANFRAFLLGGDKFESLKQELATCHQGVIQGKKHVILDKYSAQAHKRLLKAAELDGDCAAFEDFKLISQMASAPSSQAFSLIQTMAADSSSDRLNASDELFADIALVSDYVALDEEALQARVAYAVSVNLDHSEVSSDEISVLSAMAKSVKRAHTSGCSALAAAGAFNEDAVGFSSQWMAHWASLVELASEQAAKLSEEAVKVFFLLILKESFSFGDKGTEFKVAFAYKVCEGLELGAFMASVVSKTVAPAGVPAISFFAKEITVLRAKMIVSVPSGTVAVTGFSMNADSGLSLFVGGREVGYVFTKFSLVIAAGTEVIIGTGGNFTAK